MKSAFKSPPGELTDPLAVAAYDYELPEELVAAEPEARRDDARMMFVDLDGESIEHARFRRITEYLRPGDRLVFNDTQVLPGRVMTQKPTGGRVELLVLEVKGASWVEERDEHTLECMTRSSNPLRAGTTLTGQVDPEQRFEVLETRPGRATISARFDGSAAELLERHGQMPLPPYIVSRRKALGADELTEDDRTRYQTVYASVPGAIAAPTAGLHFTEELLTELDACGVTRSHVTLHVGVGTFKPMDGEHLSDHEMHTELYEIRPGLADELEATRQAGGRIIAVGTTSARVLEAEARKEAPFVPGAHHTDLFLYPGHGFVYCDGLVTNFHLPSSTLLTLVASVCGYDRMRKIYDLAIQERYRFYSYGDGMLLLGQPRQEDSPA